MIVDQGNALLQGMQVVPDLGAIDARNRQLRAQEMQLQAALQEQQREFDQQVAWERDVEAVQRGEIGPAEARELLLRHPQRREAIIAAFGNPAEEATQANLRQAGSILNRLEANDAQGAIRILQQRVEADRAAGREDPEDVAMLQALQSGDPQAIAAARSQLSVVIAAMDGSGEFTSSLERLNPRPQQTTFQRDYDFILQNFGPQVAANFRARNTDRTATDAAGNIVELPDAPLIGPETQARGGDRPSGGGGGSGAPASSPRTVQTVMQSALESGTMSRRDYSWLRDQFGNAEALDGFVRTQNIRVEGGASTPVTVRSVQQAESLAPGTRYRTPDGREFIR